MPCIVKRTLMVRIICTSTSQADQIVALLQTDLATKNISQRVTDMQRIVSRAGTVLIICEIRFNVATDATDIKDSILSKWSSGPFASSILASSKVGIHDCVHDESQPNWHPCVEDVIVVK